jgi:hypothetical protein
MGLETIRFFWFARFNFADFAQTRQSEPSSRTRIDSLGLVEIELSRTTYLNDVFIPAKIG